MSQWKLFIDRSKDTESNYSGSKHKKFTPKKSFKDQNSPSRFHNRTVDRANSSMMSQQKEKSLGRSFVGKNQQIEPQRHLKSSASQMKLNANIQQPVSKKNTLESRDSLMGYNVGDGSRVKGRQLRNQASLRIQKSLLFDQIQRLKKQFAQFQSIILRQLHRQQKIVNSMIEQILSKIKQGTLIPQKKLEKPQAEYGQPHTPREKSVNPIIRNIEKKNSMDQPSQYNKDKDLKILDKSLQNNLLVEKKNFDIHSQVSQSRQRSTYNKFSFNRFFQAMNNLKKQIKQINQITNLDPVPKLNFGFKNNQVNIEVK